MKSQLRTLLIISAAMAGAYGAAQFHVRERVAAHIAAFGLDQDLLGHRISFIAVVALWALLSVYWEIAGRNGSVPTSSEPSASRGFHVLMTNFGVMLILAPLRGCGRLWTASTRMMAVGLMVELAGASVAIWARHVLGCNWSGRVAINEGQVLIRSGPYKLVRHPIYTGFLTMSVGAALVTGERLALVGLMLLLLAYSRKVRLEESKLCLAFGSEYDAYRHQTWGLLPGIF